MPLNLLYIYMIDFEIYIVVVNFKVIGYNIANFTVSGFAWNNAEPLFIFYGTNCF